MENKFSFGFQHFSYDDSSHSDLYKLYNDLFTIAAISTFICIFGLVANGIVLWLLGCCTKRNPFTTYILNLTVSDFGFLLFLFLFIICFFINNFVAHWLIPHIVTDVLYSLLLLTHCSCQFLLTTISIDRCVAELFPNWQRCHQSPNCPPTVCTLMWILLFLLWEMQLIQIFTGRNHYLDLMAFEYFATTFICLPLMTIATLSLFIQVCFKLQKHQRRKLPIIILLLLLFSLLFSALMNALLIGIYFEAQTIHLEMYIILCSSLKSSMNSLFFLLVGKWKVYQCQENMKVILQRVFKEEEPQHVIQTQF